MSKKAETTGAGHVRPTEDASPTALSAVSGLMEERRRYESWLAGLEARRETTPPRVFARVHADYTTRLETVVAQLVTHVEALRGELGSLTTKLSSVRDEQQQVRDERAESELRAHVGELSAEEWESTARRADERIDALISRHADLETELARTRELLSDAERPATPHLSSEAVPGTPRTDPSVDANISAAVNAAAANPTPGSVPAVGDSSEAAMHVPSAGASATDREVALPKPAGRTASADAGLPSELPPSVIAAEAELLEGPSSPRQPPPKRASTSFDELAFLNSVVDTSAASPASPASPAKAAEPSRKEQVPARRESYTAKPKDSGIENLDATADKSILNQSSRTSTPMAANISGNNPIILKDKSAENAKTLKCADCGALNYPTEWYCERCGAELASL